MSRDYFKSSMEQLASAILSFLCGGSAHLSCPVYSLTLGLCSAGAPEPALSLNWGQKKQTQSSCLDMPHGVSESWKYPTNVHYCLDSESLLHFFSAHLDNKVKELWLKRAKNSGWYL